MVKTETYLPVVNTTYHLTMIYHKMENRQILNVCKVSLSRQGHPMELKAREKFAKTIEDLRAGRSYRSFAKLLGVSHPTIKAWENLEGIPDVENLERVASIRGESLNEFREFLDGTREPSSFQNLILQMHTVTDEQLAVVLRVIATRLEKQ